MCDGHDDQPRSSPRAAWENLARSDLPLPRRLRLLVSNNWLKARKRQSCCGHYGEPGC